MKKFYLTSAMFLTLGGAAFAQTDNAAPADGTAVPAEAAAENTEDALKTGLIRASALDDVDLYSVDVTGGVAWDDSMVYSDLNADWERIGEIEDLVVDMNDSVVGVIAEVGGFLGMGEKEVFLSSDEIAIVMTPDKVAFVSALSKDALEEREDAADDMFDR